MAGLVHWYEGQYLHPHHFQVMQRQILEQIASERRLSSPYSSGIIQSDFSIDALSNYQIRFNRLRLIMPSGLPIDYPKNTDLPPLLDIKEAFEANRGSLTVSIGVPVWTTTRGNTIDPDSGQDPRDKRIYKVVDEMQVDENNGENSQAVLTRRINARLLLDGDDETDLEVLPLLRLTSSGGEDLGLPRIDPAFIPPCRVLSASPTLIKIVRDLTHQVSAGRKEAMVQLTRGGFSPETIRGVQFQQMLRFQTLSRFSALLPQLVRVREITPFEVYLILMELLGELSALDPTRDRLETIDYEPNQLGLIFRDLTDRISLLLKSAESQGSFSLASFNRKDDAHVASLSPDHFVGASEYFLAIQTRDDLQQVVKHVTNSNEFKLTTLAKAGKRIRGLELEFEQNPPLQLPAKVGMLYFRILTANSAAIWEEVQKEATLAASYRNLDQSDYQMTLYVMNTSA